MSKYSFISAILLSWACTCGTLPAGAGPLESADVEYPVALCVVPEMNYVPELDSWSACRPDAFAEHLPHVRSDWKTHSRWVAKRLTPELVRSLSRWARPQMAAYRAVPPLEDLQWKPVAVHEPHGKLVLEATVDTLPVHAPLVTRWLKLYLLYDMQGKSILRVTITIRGARFE